MHAKHGDKLRAVFIHRVQPLHVLALSHNACRCEMQIQKKNVQKTPGYSVEAAERWSRLGFCFFVTWVGAALHAAQVWSFFIRVYECEADQNVQTVRAQIGLITARGLCRVIASAQAELTDLAKVLTLQQQDARYGILELAR